MADFNDINIGTTANDGTGDKPRDVGTKINTAWAKLRSFFTDYFSGANLKSSVFVSTVATGTAPIVVSSETMVPSLYAELAQKLLRVTLTDVNLPLQSRFGLYHVAWSANTLNAPWTNSALGIMFQRSSTVYTIGDWIEVTKSASGDGLKYIRFVTAGGVTPTFSPWQTAQTSNNSNLSTIDWNAKIGIFSDVIRQTAQKTPASATAAGVKGDIAHDANYIYVCTATNTWKRVAIATW